MTIGLNSAISTEYMMSLPFKSQAILSTIRKPAIRLNSILEFSWFPLRLPIGDNGVLHCHPTFWPLRDTGIQKITKAPAESSGSESGLCMLCSESMMDGAYSIT